MPRQFPPSTGLANWRKEYTDQFVIGTEDLRTLDSVPLALITPPTATSIVVPLFAFQFVKAGSVVFSNAIAPALNIDVSGSVVNITLQAFDGSAAIVEFVDGVLSQSTLDFTGIVGLPLLLVGGSDETGGDGTVLTLEITYLFRETAGLI